ncbi:MAG: segregation/condensation protein A [Spirochaetes bacterium]|nr:segregation/condensation protein A [Spirochaetota bacterium]
METQSAGIAQRFQIGGFEGPLDLLLFLIKKNEINIYDIPISQITEQYLEYLRFAERVDLENITEFYLMAATLLYIKSRMLLPVEVDFGEEYEDPRKELVEKLIEYQKIKKLSELIGQRGSEAEWLIERKNRQRILPFVDETLWQQISVWDLFKTFSSIVTSLSAEHVLDLYEEVSINEKIALLYELLEKKREILFTELIVRPDSIMDIVCSFLAVLELARQRKIRLMQNKMFGDIRIVSVEQGLENDAG